MKALPYRRRAADESLEPLPGDLRQHDRRMYTVVSSWPIYTRHRPGKRDQEIQIERWGVGLREIPSV